MGESSIQSHPVLQNLSGPQDLYKIKEVHTLRAGAVIIVMMLYSVFIPMITLYTSNKKICR